MFVESIIRRPTGTKVEMGGVLYHFRPGAIESDPFVHAADVDDDAHLARFLSITEGYRIYRGQQQQAYREPQRKPGEMVPQPTSRFDPPLDLQTLTGQQREDVRAGRADPAELQEGLSGHALLRQQTASEQAPSGSGPEKSPAEGGQVPEEHQDEDGEDGDEDGDDAAAKPPGTAPSPAAPPADLSKLTRDELVALHKDRFGRAPHARLSDDKLRELLSAGAAD